MGQTARHVRFAGWAAFALTSPLSLSASQLALGLAALGGLGMIAAGQRVFPGRAVAASVVFLLAVTLATALTASDAARGLREFVEFWPYLLLLALPLPARPERSRAPLLRLLAVAVSAAAVYAVVQHFVGIDYLHQRLLDNPHGRYRAVAFFSHHLTWAGYALAAALFFAGLRPRRRSDRILFALASVLALSGLLTTYARGPLLGFAAGAVVLLWLGRPRWKIAALAVSTVIVALALTPGLFGRFAGTGAVDLNPRAPESRTAIWATAWQMGWSRPLSGVGPGNFAGQFEAFKAHPDLLPVSHAHNQWLDFWATSGIPGVLAFTLLWGAVAVRLLRRRRQPDGLPVAALAAIVGLCAAALTECHFSDAEILMLAVFLAGLGLLADPPAAETRHRGAMTA